MGTTTDPAGALALPLGWCHQAGRSEAGVGSLAAEQAGLSHSCGAGDGAAGAVTRRSPLKGPKEQARVRCTRLCLLWEALKKGKGISL